MTLIDVLSSEIEIVFLQINIYYHETPVLGCPSR